MATRTVVCPECESPLAPGRFSCSACGALVASVAGVGRSFILPEILRPTEPDPAAAVDAATQPAVVPATGPAPDEPRSSAAEDGWDDVRDELEVAASNGDAHDVAIDDLPLAAAASPGPTVEPADSADAAPPAELLVDAEVKSPADVAEFADTPSATEAFAPADAPAEPAWPDHPTWPLPTVDPRVPPAVLAMATAPDEEAAAPGGDNVATGGAAAVGMAASARMPAGVYLPPSAVLPPGEALPLPGGAADVSSLAGSEKPRASRGPLSGLADSLDAVAVPSDAGTRTIAIGGGIAVLGFLLPWADVVIGSRSLDGGLLSTWGLAGPAAPFALVLVLGLTALAILRPNLPRWVGLSSFSIALAALLIGILWPYLFGSFSAAIGVYVVAVSAFVLAAGGLVDRVASRHEDPTTGV